MSDQNQQPVHPNLRVLIVCRQKLIREGLRLLAEQAEDVTVVGAVSGVKAALDLTSQICPEVALACLDPTAGAIYDEVQQLILNRPGLPVIVVAADPPVAQVQAWVEAGAFGVLPLDAEPDELLHALYAARRGQRTLHPTLARQLILHLADAHLCRTIPTLPARTCGGAGVGTGRCRQTGPSHYTLHDLTPREREVLAHLAQGACDKDIAQALFISVRTVQTHLAHIYEKLGVRSRTEAALLAVQEGWMQPSVAEASSQATT